MPKQRLQYRYDAVGNRSGLTTPDGGRFTYSYDSLQRLTRVENPEGQRTTFSYDLAGRRTLTLLANGGRCSTTYDDASRITAVYNLKSGGTPQTSFDYGYDDAGNRTRVVDVDGRRTTWAYDAASQLTVIDSSGLQSIPPPALPTLSSELVLASHGPCGRLTSKWTFTFAATASQLILISNVCYDCQIFDCEKREKCGKSACHVIRRRPASGGCAFEVVLLSPGATGFFDVNNNASYSSRRGCCATKGTIRFANNIRLFSLAKLQQLPLEQRQAAQRWFDDQVKPQQFVRCEQVPVTKDIGLTEPPFWHLASVIYAATYRSFILQWDCCNDGPETTSSFYTDISGSPSSRAPTRIPCE